MQWTVVHFIEENMVEAVPMLWLHENLCYWPPYNGKRLNNAIATCEKPIINSWPLFKIRRLGNGCIYDTLLKARAKASVAEDTSDLASECEGKRIPKKKTYLYESNESSNELSNTLPNKLSDKFSNELSNESLDYSSDESLDNNQITAPQNFPTLNHTDNNECTTPKPSTSKTSAKTTINKENVVKLMKSNNSKHNLLSRNTSYPSFSTPDITFRDKTNDNDIEFKKQVLRQLHMINLRQTQMWEDVQTIITTINKIQDDKTPIINNEESIFNKFVFPLKSINELDAVEEFLTDETNVNMFVKELTKIGGATYKHTIKRIMCRLFSNEVAQNYSWIGFKGKNKFCLLRIAAVVISAVQKTHSSAITLCDIETAIKIWLVKAKSRTANKI